MTEKTWTPRRVILHLLVGLIAGLLSGLFGVGGGILIVPALVLVLGYGQRLAAGTSLAAIVPTATVGALSYGVTGNVAWIAALILAGGAVVGAQGGTWLLPRVPVRTLQFAFVAFLGVVIGTLFLATPARGEPFDITVVTGIALALLGLITGVLSGLLGVGGGIVVVPALMLLFGAGDLVARGTSLMMMIPAALSGTIGNLRFLNVNLIGAGLIGLAACTTAAVGVWLAQALDPFVGSVVFTVFLAAVAAQLTVRAIRRPRR